MSKATKQSAQAAFAASEQPDDTAPETERRYAAQGLKLSEIFYKPLDWFKTNPENVIFAPLKTEAYWKDLERDIREWGIIRNPLIATPDGLLIEGESRVTVCKKISAENAELFKTIAVRLITTPLSPEQGTRLLLLGNYSRFEIDLDTKILIAAKIWPDYFEKENDKGGGSAKGETVSHSPQTAREIAALTGKTTRQIKNYKKVLRKAKQVAGKQGRASATVQDIREARSAVAAKRKSKPAPHLANPARVGAVQVSAQEAKEIVSLASAVKPTALRKQIIAKYRKLYGQGLTKLK